MVMPFGLTNSRVVFQNIDSILVFSQSPKVHTKDIPLVLAKLCNHGIYAQLEKHEFNKTVVEFLGQT